MEEGIEHEEQVFIEDIEEPIEQVKESMQNGDNENVENNQEEVEKEEEKIPEIVPTIENKDNKEVVTKLSFNDIDSVLEEDNQVNEVEAPKSIERLEDISVTRTLERKLEEEPSESDDDDDERIQISTDPVDLSGFDILDDSEQKISSDDIILNDVESLPPI
jgi:hypothetical protein